MAGHHQFIDSLNPQFPNSSFGDTTLTKVFVGGLAWETQSRTLQRHFEQFGEILEAVVITDKNTGRSKGYGFVTFLDPESARQACVDPNPVIDGRRANCNLASQGRPRPAPPYGPMWPIRSFYGNAPGNQVAFVRNPMYHSSVPYGYQQGFPYPSYGYTSYGPEYFYPQNVFGPSMGQLYVQMYGTPRTFTPPVYPIPQVGQQLPGPHGYAAVPVPSHQIIQLGGPSVNRVTAPPVPAVPAPFPPGVAAPALGSQSHFLIPAHSRQFSQGTSGSDQTTS